MTVGWTFAESMVSTSVAVCCFRGAAVERTGVAEVRALAGAASSQDRALTKPRQRGGWTDPKESV